MAVAAVTYVNNNSDSPSTLTRTVTFTVDDGFLTNGVEVNTTVSGIRKITVSQINVPPTINPISPPSLTILENSPAVSIPLSGIGAGANQIQNLTVSVTSDTPAVIPNPTLIYTSPNTYGSIVFQPVANTFGTAQITLTVTDSGGLVSPPVTLNITVLHVNQAPTLNPILNPPAIVEQTPTSLATLVLPTINLTGIGAGAGEVQNILQPTAVVEPVSLAPGTNPAIISGVTVTYSPSNPSGTLNYTIAPYQSGTAVIAVTVMDDGDTSNGGVNSVTQMFTVTVTPVNQQPTLGTITSPPAVPENTTALQQVMISGITAGPGDANQFLTVSAKSNNAALISVPSNGYTSPNGTAVISYVILPNVSGMATVTVTVTDNGGTANGGSQ